MQVALLLVIFVSLAISQTPHRPVWPAEFSASIVIQDSQSRRPQFFRNFFSVRENADRLDGLVEFGGEWYFAELIFDHNSRVQYNIFYQEDSIFCTAHRINKTLPRPNFKNFDFEGKGIEGMQAADIWAFADRDQDTAYRYWDAQKNFTRPLRFDIVKGGRDGPPHALTFLYREFDIGSQDPQLFQVPSFIKHECNMENKLVKRAAFGGKPLE